MRHVYRIGCYQRTGAEISRRVAVYDDNPQDSKVLHNELKGDETMQGTPKHLNTKEDYEYLRQNFPAEIWRPRFESLLAERMQWFNTGALAEGDSGQTDASHKVIEDAGMGGAAATRYQFELQENDNCLLYRLGYTVAEVERLLEVE